MATNEFLPNHARVIDSIETHLRFSPLLWITVALAAVILFSLLMPTAESAKREPASAAFLKKKALLPGLEAEPTTPSLRAALGLSTAAMPEPVPTSVGEVKVVVREPSSMTPIPDIAARVGRNEAAGTKTAAPAPAELPQPVSASPIAVASSGPMLAAHVSDHE